MASCCEGITPPDDHPEYECARCHGTFLMVLDHDAAAEYVMRFGTAPRTDDLVCDDCYKGILVTMGHCADCLDKPCTCKPAPS